LYEQSFNYGHAATNTTPAFFEFQLLHANSIITIRLSFS